MVVVEIVSLERIWDRAPHNAFTGLIRSGDRWLCTFREATSHGSPDGTVRVLRSDDGEHWSSAAEVIESGADLRDPKLSIMPDGRLMLLTGASTYTEDGRYRSRSPRVAFSDDGVTWTSPTRFLGEDHWIWRVTWHGDVGYGVSKLGEGNHPRAAFCTAPPTASSGSG